MKKNIQVEKIIHDPSYFYYLVQYEGDIESEISKIPQYYLTIINEKYAIILVKGEVELNGPDQPFIKSIVYIQQTKLYTLQEITPSEASRAAFLQLESGLNLTGKGVDIAIIDSGIDYLSDEFMDANGETRIRGIWDQTVITSNETENDFVPFGIYYDRNQINNAIKAQKEGKSPYEIVPTRDSIGHGTNMAGIIGATGKNTKVKGIAPECEFLVVKLIEDFAYENSINDIIVPVFNSAIIAATFQYLYEYSLNSNRPMVIYFPLGTNLGNHKGIGIIESFIDIISRIAGKVVVTPTGNERNTGTHTSGTLIQLDALKGAAGNVIEIQVSPEQKYLWIEIWNDIPNIMTIEIISPSGETTGQMGIINNFTLEYNFLFEKTNAKVNYYFPDELTGDQLIRIRFSSLQPGIWRIRLTGKYVTTGTYNAWMPQTGITVGNTRFSYPDPFGTVTNPGTSLYSVTVAAYNQNNNNMVEYSGLAFLEYYLNVVDIAAGGVNALTVAPDNKTAVVSGTSVAAAVVSGACAMLLQWGIVNGNVPNMNAQILKTDLIRGAVVRSGDIVPNQFWGYGILNIPNIFRNMT